MKKYRALILAIVSFTPEILGCIFRYFLGIFLIQQGRDFYNSVSNLLRGLYLLSLLVTPIIGIISLIFSIKDRNNGNNKCNVIAFVLSIIRLIIVLPFFLFLYVAMHM